MTTRPMEQTAIPPDATPSEPRRRRILYRATHRGTHEADLLVGGFVEAHLAAMTPAELDALEEVLELPDTALSDWLTGRLAVPQEMDSPMLRAMRAWVLR
jgi:antitoxin CptB